MLCAVRCVKAPSPIRAPCPFGVEVLAVFIEFLDQTLWEVLQVLPNYFNPPKAPATIKFDIAGCDTVHLGL